MGHQVAVLWDGQLVQVASPEQLYRMPVSPELARFVGDAVLLPGVADGVNVVCALGQLRLMAGMPDGAVQVLLRPEQIRLVPVHDGAGIGAAKARGRVLKVDYYGHDACVRLSLSGDAASSTVLTARLPGHLCPRPGDEVAIIVEGEVLAYRMTDPASAPTTTAQWVTPMPVLGVAKP